MHRDKKKNQNSPPPEKNKASEAQQPVPSYSELTAKKISESTLLILPLAKVIGDYYFEEKKILWRTLPEEEKKNRVQNKNFENIDFQGDSSYFEIFPNFTSDVAQAELERAQLQKANLSSMNLSSAILNQANLSQACLAKAILFRTNICGTNLREADLTDADLRKVYSFYTMSVNFTGAILLRANLTDAFLPRANFTQANLCEANLNGAELLRANFFLANLEGTKLDKMSLDFLKWLRKFDLSKDQEYLVLLPKFLEQNFEGFSFWDDPAKQKILSCLQSEQLSEKDRQKNRDWLKAFITKEFHQPYSNRHLLFRYLCHFIPHKINPIFSPDAIYAFWVEAFPGLSPHRSIASNPLLGADIPIHSDEKKPQEPDGQQQSDEKRLPELDEDIQNTIKAIISQYLNCAALEGQPDQKHQETLASKLASSLQQSKADFEEKIKDAFQAGTIPLQCALKLMMQVPPPSEDSKDTIKRDKLGDAIEKYHQQKGCRRKILGTETQTVTDLTTLLNISKEEKRTYIPKSSLGLCLLARQQRDSSWRSFFFRQGSQLKYDTIKKLTTEQNLDQSDQSETEKLLVRLVR